MRTFGLLAALLAVTGVFCDSDVRQEPDVITTRDEGSDLPILIQTLARDAAECNLVSPSNDVIQFLPEDLSGDRFELRPGNDFSQCQVTINDLKVEDTGLWNLYIKSRDGTVYSQHYILTVTGSGTTPETAPETTPEATPESTPEATPESTPDANFEIAAETDKIDEEKKIKLSKIEYLTRKGATVTIAVSKTSYAEECYLHSPSYSGKILGHDIIENVKVLGNSPFISCGVTIGPMDASLLGEYTLCGKRVEDRDHERCQPATIAWYNNDPDSEWETELQPRFDHVTNFGATLTPVVRESADIRTCHVITPNGEDLVVTPDSDYPNIRRESINDKSFCRIAIGPIDASLLGDWVIYGIFDSPITGLILNRLPMHFYLYDEENPHQQAYNITVLDSERHHLPLGGSLDIEVVGAGLVDGCVLLGPSGEKFEKGASTEYKGVSFIEVESSATCLAAVGPFTREMFGEWKLTGKFNHRGLFTEIQRSFYFEQEDPYNPVEENRRVIYLDERRFDTKVGEVQEILIDNIDDGFTLHESCHIRTPDGAQYKIMKGFHISGIEVIEQPEVACGVNVTVVNNMSGQWNLISRETHLGENIERKLPFIISIEEELPQVLQFEHDLGSSVDVDVGPKDTEVQFCKLEGPSGDILHEAVGPCRLRLDRVLPQHNGLWTASYWTSDRITTQTLQFVLLVRVSRPSVSVHVEKDSTDRSVSIKCSVPTQATVTACVFRDPSGQVLVANQGVRDDRFEYLAVEDSETNESGCGLRIVNTARSDLGIWRCSIFTEDDVLYGFPTVLCPWAMSDPEVAAEVQSEPILTPRQSVSGNDGDSITMSCSVQAAIRYCYFRAQNGSIYNAIPGVPGAAEYHGAGLEAGECGIQFDHLFEGDSGLWSCHVGFPDPALPEQRASLQVAVQRPFRAELMRFGGNTIIVRGATVAAGPVDYCRFVRIDGFGFTSSNIPDGYVDRSDLLSGICEMLRPSPTMLDLHPWVVAAKPVYELYEVSDTTGHFVAPSQQFNRNPSYFILWFCVIGLSALLFALGVMLAGPKKYRERTMQRFSSFRNSFKKQPMPVSTGNATAPA